MAVLRSKPLLPLKLSGFLMNLFMASFFFYFPLIVTGQHHMKLTRYYEVLLPMLFASGITMFGFSRAADRGWGRAAGAAAFLTLLLGAVLLFRPSAGGLDPGGLASILIPGTLFFIGFTGLEPVLPSLVSKSAPECAYGTALGSYHTLQYLGSFAGGSLAGALSRFPDTNIMSALVAASLVGFCLMLWKPRA